MMTPEQQRIAIAEKCGWKLTSGGLWESPIPIESTLLYDSITYGDCPNYPNDLNAVHEAEKLVDKQKYCIELNKLVRSQPLEPAPFWWALIHATAAQCCEALCRVWFPERFTN